MRYKQPRATGGHNGGFGGVGTRPADRAWTPAARRPSGDADPVPRKWRRLRLRRKRARERNDIAPKGSPAGDIGLGILFILCAFGSLYVAAADSAGLSFAPLLFLGLCALGAVFLGRGISKRQVIRRAQDPDAERRSLAEPEPVALFVARAQGWVILAGGCLAWGLVALPVLGSFHPFKAAFALALYMGLGISLNVSNFGVRRRRVRKGYATGRHAARAERWSSSRRSTAILTGVVLVALGISLTTAAGPEGGKWVLRIALSLIVACAFGISLIGVAATAGAPEKPRR